MYKIFSLAPIRLLKRGKTTYIKRLQKVRRVRRHTDSNNLILLAVLLECERIIALIAINYE
jgi:hypothetical protein